MQNLLKEFGIEYLESEIFFLCEGLSFHFDINAFNQSKKLFFVFKTLSQLIELFEQNTGLHFMQFGKSHNIQELLLSETPKPILAQVDTHLLKYYQRIDESEITIPEHTILLYEIYEDKVRVGDPFVVNNQGMADCYEGYVNIKDLQYGISNYFCLSPNLNYIKLSEKSIIQKIRSNLMQFTQKSEQNKHVTGMPALYHFLKTISNLPPYKVAEKYLWIETAFVLNGNMMFINDYLADILFQYSHCIRNSPSNIIKMISGIKNEWTYAYRLILKIGYKRAENLYPLVVNTLHRVLDLQNRCFDMIISCMEK